MHPSLFLVAAALAGSTIAWPWQDDSGAKKFPVLNYHSKHYPYALGATGSGTGVGTGTGGSGGILPTGASTGRTFPTFPIPTGTGISVPGVSGTGSGTGTGTGGSGAPHTSAPASTTTVTSPGVTSTITSTHTGTEVITTTITTFVPCSSAIGVVSGSTIYSSSLTASTITSTTTIQTTDIVVVCPATAVPSATAAGPVTTYYETACGCVTTTNVPVYVTSTTTIYDTECGCTRTIPAGTPIGSSPPTQPTQAPASGASSIVGGIQPSGSGNNGELSPSSTVANLPGQETGGVGVGPSGTCAAPETVTVTQNTYITVTVGGSSSGNSPYTSISGVAPFPTPSKSGGNSGVFPSGTGASSGFPSASGTAPLGSGTGVVAPTGTASAGFQRRRAIW